MNLTKDEAAFVDNLRRAAEQYGAVFDLLCLIDEGIMIDGNGNKEVVAEADELRLIQCARVATSFARLDRDEK